MKISRNIYRFKNGEMKLFRKYEEIYDIISINAPIRRWYRKNPYAKRVDKNWICSDYRVDQQRPQRNVYSEAYIEIISMTDMEEVHFDRLIENLEKDIEYPTVWDDGKNEYYEETIYCPKCGKRRKVLTSETHCEFCGFEFSKALKCPKCNTMYLKGDDECKKCGYVFRKESFINNNDYEVKKDEYIQSVKCPKCGSRKSKYFSKCKECGFDFNNRKECPKCNCWVDESDKYCGNCGMKLKVLIECENCGEKNNSENRYCNYCGNKL